MPTNILLAPTVPLTTDHGLLTTDTTPLTTNNSPLTNTSTPGPNGGISPQDKPGPGPNVCLSDDSNTTANVAGLPCGSPGVVFVIDCPTCSGNSNAGVPSDAVNSASGYSAGSPPGIFTEHPVRYGDGVVKLSTTDLESDGFGQVWGQTRSWTNAGGAFPTTALNGTGWIITELPYLLQVTSNNLVLVTNGVNYRYFDFNGSNWVERFYGQENLVSGSPHEYVFTDTTGDQMHFSDFSTSIPTNQKGQLKSWVDPDGNTTSVISRTADGKPTEVQRSVTVGSTTTSESLLYSYVPSGTNAGLLQNVTLRRQVNGGSWTIIRQVAYTYYDGVEAHGNAGDLKLAVIEDGAGNALDTKYYRYYVSESTGYQHALKYVFNPQSYATRTARPPTTPTRPRNSHTMETTTP